ncbi:hypothetical protein GOP47_0002312 [Adiantum capillus-veneris]|uniref:Uncharacterized protein n=1 Tax=Adiantum capillus-veneris TaxID=13818 RepID=A0A9D4ZP32_ADICA|nr:hypothetical protein GOP47_0002312 [Adiantum capillus-veneris]
MYTSRDRTGLGLHHSSTPCCFSSPTRCYSACRSPSPSLCRTTCNHLCDCPVSTPHCVRKTVRFDHRNPRLGRSRSVNRGRYNGGYTDSSSVYRATSPTLFSRPKSVLDDSKMMEYANLNVLLRRLSILQLEMKGLLNGKSLRERVQMMGQKLDDDIHLSSLKATTPCKDVWPMESSKLPANCAHHMVAHGQTCAHPHVQHVSTLPVETHKWLQAPPFRKKEKQEPSFYCRKHDASRPRRFLEEPQQHLNMEELIKSKATDPCDALVADLDWKEKKQMVQLWRDYNCDLHLRRIIDGSRKEAACRILERVVHAQLTYYMLQYIGAVAKGLMGDEKTHYLSFFKREGPFKNKPLNEGTYCELLSFVDKEANPAKDVTKALEVSEEGLEEEGGRGGYDPNAIGDIRAQMRVLVSVVANSSSPCPNSVPVAQVDDDDTLFTRAFLYDLMKAVDQGKLGALQHAHGLIKLACFLALKRVESST